MPNMSTAISGIKSHPLVQEFISNSVSKPKIIQQGALGAGLFGANKVVEGVNEGTRKDILNLNANQHLQKQQPQDNAYNPWTDAKSLALGIGGPSIAALLVYNALNRAAQRN